MSPNQGREARSSVSGIPPTLAEGADTTLGPPAPPLLHSSAIPYGQRLSSSAGWVPVMGWGEARASPEPMVDRYPGRADLRNPAPRTLHVLPKPPTD